VVRHALVQRIVRAYESAKPQQQELPLGIGEGMPGEPEAREPRVAQQTKPQ
jgi:phosphate starvation-inducible PhoH-like protein